MSLDILIQLHEMNERLAEIDELKGDLPELLNDQKHDFNEMNTNQKDDSLKIDELFKRALRAICGHVNSTGWSAWPYRRAISTQARMPRFSMI